MRVTFGDENCVVINDPYVYSLLKRTNKLDEFGGMIRAMCVFGENDSFDYQSKIMEELQVIKGLRSNEELIEVIKGLRPNEELIEVIKGLRTTEMKPSNDLIDKLNVLSIGSRNIYDKLDNIKKGDDLAELRAVMEKNIMELKMLFMETKTKTTKTKGMEGENEVLRLLEENLRGREGYSIGDVHGKSHNCDIVVKKIGHGDIHIDVKNYSGEKVRQKEVDKFVSDLNGLDCSGIMISTNSGIVGKGDLEFEQLSCGKYAVYISSNKYDVDMMIEFIRILHVFENLTKTDESISISIETMQTVKNMVIDMKKKMDRVKTSLKTSLSTLNDINIDVIETLVLGNVKVTQVAKEDQFVCYTCNHVCKSKSGLTNHMKNCVKVT